MTHDLVCNLPIEIHNDETIVRVVMCPQHVKKDKLKPAAFRSKAGTDELSVIRQTYMGSDFCKTKGKEIASNNSNVKYNGFAVISAQHIRSTNSNVFDSREEYCGHAHVSHGIILQPDEPPNSQSSIELGERLRTLVQLTAYYPDPYPDASEWLGKQLLPTKFL